VFVSGEKRNLSEKKRTVFDRGALGIKRVHTPKRRSKKQDNNADDNKHF
jgi:hypothetical protein